jgi:Flp pilus assembly protein TadD
LAAKAARLSPTNAAFHGTLGTAQYRAGHWTDAAVALEKAIGLRGNDNPVNADEAFVLAMTRWQLGDKAAARHWFEKGTDWMSRSKTRDDEARRFRAEAAKLLGIMDDAKRPDHKTPKQSP